VAKSKWEVWGSSSSSSGGGSASKLREGRQAKQTEAEGSGGARGPERGATTLCDSRGQAGFVTVQTKSPAKTKQKQPAPEI
jgi:hypothetical protein